MKNKMYTLNNQKYIPVENSGIGSFIILVDGINLYYWDKARKHPYMKLEDAIAWYEKELKKTNVGPEENKQLTANLEVLKNLRNVTAEDGEEVKNKTR